MTQINAELGEISEGIDKISEFQDNEYKSRVFSLVTQVKKIAAFQGEILENEELRRDELDHLNQLEDECTQLLGQANLTIADFAKKKDLDYDSYEKQLQDAQNWHVYQQTLLEVLYKISDLRYALYMGNASREQCTALLPTYTKRVSDAHGMLVDWHEDNAKRLGIELSESKRKRTGFDGVIHWLPGLIKEDFNFRAISEKTAELISIPRCIMPCAMQRMS